jgi:NADH:ubiquinone oxidoreductase subunit F (NADH-binding)
VTAPLYIYRDLETPGIGGLEAYRAAGGYQAFEKALKTMTPVEVV